MIDSHMHINSKFTRTPYKEICKTTYNIDLTHVINVGLDIETSKEISVYARRNPKMYCSIGIHPLYIDNQDINELYSMVTDKVVAIGEIGLDSNDPNYQIQRRYLIEQIIIANELKLPVIIHSNNSNQEIIKIFETIVKPQYGCVFHCFQPELNILKYLVKNGYYVSFAGKITQPNAKKSLEVIKNVPEDLYLVETDSPYMVPYPLDDEYNHSNNLPYIINRIAEVKKIEPEKVEEQTTKNTLRLFKKMH